MAGLVVTADWVFSATAAVLQWMAHLAGLPPSTPWILWSFVPYFLAGACWLPVVWMQIGMRRMAEDAARRATPLPPRCFACLRAWTALGVPAFSALVVVFRPMAARPS